MSCYLYKKLNEETFNDFNSFLNFEFLSDYMIGFRHWLAIFNNNYDPSKIQDSIEKGKELNSGRYKSADTNSEAEVQVIIR